jgi:ABC-type nickel/cobalt efflux system permease component RcnA
MVVGFYAALPNALRRQTLAAMLLSVGATLMYALRQSSIPLVDVLTIAESFAIANAIGWYVSRRRDRLEASEEEALLREQSSRLELEQTLRELRVLRGIIPICSHCRKIRSEVGDWQRLETYMHEHTDAEISHGLCPACLDEHYPAVAEEMRRGPIPPM